MNIDFSGKTALITGAGRGLGKVIAEKFAESGAEVWVADVKKETAEQSAQDIRAKGAKADSYAIDISDMEAMKKMFDHIEEKSGKLDIVVNCAGIIYDGTYASCEDEKIKQILNINVVGTSYGIKYALEKMIPRKYGKIVNIASIAGRRGRKDRPFYSISKAAVISMTQSAAYDAAPHGINVNAICPGTIRTAMMEKLLDEMERKTGVPKEEIWQKRMDETIPLRRAQTEEDIAYAIMFLCSDFAKNITGQALNVCGGNEMN